MSSATMLTRYVQKARAVGVEVELMALDELPRRLTALLSEHRKQLSTAAPPLDREAERGGEDPPTASSRKTAPLLALSASGWPRELLETVQPALLTSGFRIVSPGSSSEDRGYLWNREELEGASLGITFCEAFLAETGSLVLAAGPGQGTLASLLPEIHLALSTADGCCENLADHLSSLTGRLPSRLTLITGPSRTGDIEATMTTGVHGPRRVLHWIFADPKDHM